MSKLEINNKAVDLRNQIDGILTSSGYRYTRSGTTDKLIRYNLGMSLDLGETDLFILCHFDRGFIEIVSTVPFKVPEKYKREVALYLHEVNLRMNMGHFDFDISNRIIHSRTSILLKDLILDQEVFEKCVYLNLTVIEDFIPGVMRIIYADQTAISVMENPIKKGKRNTGNRDQNGQIPD
tara:strand:+ start:407 stop:946 length:540 start_codon:yes stop_codon:yes gene_type:complete